MFDSNLGSRAHLVIRSRTGSAWELERVALIIANSLEGDVRAREFLECTIRITKRVPEPFNLSNDISGLVSVWPWH